MNLLRFVFIELWHRKSQLISGLLAITLGIGVIVSIQSISVVSEKAVAVKLDNLGANILVLPLGTGIDDYYAADIDAPTMPGEYVERILTSSLQGVDNLSPKLTRRVNISGQNIVLTGILPSSEIASKPLWQNTGLFSEELQQACVTNGESNQSHGYENELLQRKAVDTLATTECLVGSEAAKKLALAEGSELLIENQAFRVSKILPETGTIDDDRVFAHLTTVQNLLGIQDQVSAIEIMGCCNAISDGLLAKLRNILPDTRITTIVQIVSTQIETNKLMNKISIIFLIIILFVGGISIGNYIWANVNERRKEIGILRMVGARKNQIYYLLFIKALILGILGGIFGYIIGTIAAMLLGPYMANLAVHPVPIFLLWSVLISTFISFIGASIPAYLAGKIDPFINMQEV
jgi:putative ABC transport system permease protein